MERIQESVGNNSFGRNSVDVKVLKHLKELLQMGLLTSELEFEEVEIGESRRYLAFITIEVEGAYYTVQVFSGSKKLDNSTHLGIIRRA